MIGDGHPIWKAEHWCLFVVKEKNELYRYSLLFKSKNQPQEHRIKSRHVINQAQSDDSSEKPVKQLRLEDLMVVLTITKTRMIKSEIKKLLVRLSIL